MGQYLIHLKTTEGNVQDKGHIWKVHTGTYISMDLTNDDKSNLELNPWQGWIQENHLLVSSAIIMGIFHLSVSTHQTTVESEFGF